MLLPLRNNLQINPYVGRFRPETSSARRRVVACRTSVNLVTEGGGPAPQPDPVLAFRPETPEKPAPSQVRVAKATDNAGLSPQPNPPRQFRPDR